MGEQKQVTGRVWIAFRSSGGDFFIASPIPITYKEVVHE